MRVAKIRPGMPPVHALITHAGNRKGKAPAPVSSPTNSTDSQRLAPLPHDAKLKRNACERTARCQSRTGAPNEWSAIRAPAARNHSLNRLYVWMAKGRGAFLSSPMYRFPRRTVPNYNLGRSFLVHSRLAIVPNLWTLAKALATGLYFLPF